MPLAAIVVAWALLVFPGGIPVPSLVPKAQATPSSPQPEKAQASPAAQTPVPSQPGSQSGPQPNSDQPSPPKSTSPCAETSPPATTESKDCTSAAPNMNTKPNATGKATSPKKKVVRNGSTTDPSVQIAPSVPGRQASKALQNTNQLLATTDTNLKKLSGRTLTPAQQETLTQIKNYMDQSRKAADNGDPQRAYNLAHKANLLSAELVGP